MRSKSSALALCYEHSLLITIPRLNTVQFQWLVAHEPNLNNTFLGADLPIKSSWTQYNQQVFSDYIYEWLENWKGVMAMDEILVHNVLRYFLNHVNDNSKTFVESIYIEDM